MSRMVSRRRRAQVAAVLLGLLGVVRVARHDVRITATGDLVGSAGVVFVALAFTVVVRRRPGRPDRRGGPGLPAHPGVHLADAD